MSDDPIILTHQLQHAQFVHDILVDRLARWERANNNTNRAFSKDDMDALEIEVSKAATDVAILAYRLTKEKT